MLRYKNPVHPSYLADPFVWKHGPTWYAIGTGLLEAYTLPNNEAYPPTRSGDPGVFLLLRSDNLVDWTEVGSALKLLPQDYGTAYWAPEVAYENGLFHLYYSLGRSDKQHHIRLATSPAPEGPYLDTGALLTSPYTCPFAIDPSPFQDDDGQWYLFYARDFLDTDAGARAGTALVVDRLVTMDRLAGEERTVARPRHDWQRYIADRVMYGGQYDWHTLEGPCVRKRNGIYYCLFSAGRWEDATYGVDWVTSKSVTGPYQDQTNSDGARILRTIPGRVLGPGHCSITEGPDGSEMLAYHAWDVQKTGRRLCIDPLTWTMEGPKTTGPSYTEQML